MFSESDLTQINALGMDVKQVNEQVNRFRNGFPPLNVVKPATPGDGILVLEETESAAFVDHFEKHPGGFNLLKFVPASGAASRMFKDLFEALNQYSDDDDQFAKLVDAGKLGRIKEMMTSLGSFAFYDLLNKRAANNGEDLENLLKEKRYARILRLILEQEGLGYGFLPKGLLEFHKYPDASRTPTEEHMVEGALYCRQADDRVNLHFTVSPEHEALFTELIQERGEAIVREYGVTFSIEFSKQKSSTDRIAVDMENNPFRDENGRILFRPGGHGALLENLNDLEADIIYIKNIDNVVPDLLKQHTMKYKKALGGLLIQLTSKTHAYIKKLEDIKDENGLIKEVVAFMEDELAFRFPASFNGLPTDKKAAYLKKNLNRPIRVCGMVKNEGEPGGGPFWVKNRDGSETLQIAESSQLDLNDPAVERIFNEATHFNPVDLVCSVRAYDGKRFDLMQFRDPETGFISIKSKDGKELKALELPGLWNGAMAFWNTIFVEVPIATFNPVKTIYDLLREQHQA